MGSRDRRCGGSSFSDLECREGTEDKIIVAGSGKTTLMKEAVHLIKDSGKHVTVLAPSAQASRDVLRKEGFEQAETVAKFFTDSEMQAQIQGQVLWVDEAGLLGTRDMKELLEIATNKDARLILGGDTRQHASVVRGDALRILNTVGDIKTAEFSKIYRQQNFEYRSVVEDLSKGKVKEAFEKLDTMGAIKQIDPLKPNEQIVKDYLDAIEKKKSALVISPTHKAGEALTKDIRNKMRESGMIGKKEINIVKYTNLNLTEAQKSDWRNFKEGQSIQFNQNMPGIKRGSVWSVKEIKGKEVSITDTAGIVTSLPRHKAKDYDVFQKSTIGLSKGDKVIINRPGFDTEKKRLENGMMLDVVSVSDKGVIELSNSKSKTNYNLSHDFGHISHGHVITSYASQGKTVDRVFISQPASTFAATDAKQFYVCVSRGRHEVYIYTDNREALVEEASKMGDRLSALELVNKDGTHLDFVLQNNRNEYSLSPLYDTVEKSYSENYIIHREDYEPEI